MMLVEAGKLSLDDKLTRVLDDLPAAWEMVTIRQLLNHTSGIPDFAKKLDFHVDMRKDFTERQIIALVANDPLDFRPGERMSYSNTGYFLLGMVIEKTSGRPYGDFLRERIFQPLGMAATRFNNLRAVIPNRARGYGLEDAMLYNAEYVSPSIPFAAGGLVSSAADMTRWALAQGSQKLLKAASWEAMWTPGGLNDGKTTAYGFGWYVRSKWSRKRVEHLGGIQGFNGGIVKFIDGDLTVIVLFNSEYAHAERFLWGIYGIYLPDTMFKPPTPITDDDEATTQFLREVTTALAQGTGDPSWFTSAVQQFYFPNRIKARKLMLGVFGPLTSFQLIGSEAKPGERKRSYRAVFGETPFRFTFQLTQDGRVAGVDFDPE
jgi:CubicO group peptidase (beta-lactamase class C family)